MAYRVLLILSAVYRRWATLRLSHLRVWIAQWELPEMFVGVKGRGADDPWGSTALLMEEAAVDKKCCTGGAADIYKCFDQLVRPLIYEILRIGGMPTRIIGTYQKYQDGVQVHNSIAGGLGVAYSKHCSIPHHTYMILRTPSAQHHTWQVAGGR